MYNENLQYDNLVKELAITIKNTLGNKVLGVYLYGSLVWGDFDPETSDIDVLTIISSDINEEELKALEKMHKDFVSKYPKWDNRIEVQYFSKDALKSFKTKSSKMANISPGEPLHIINSGIECLMNWYFVQEQGKTLYGPSPKTFIDSISKKEFIEAVKKHALWWKDHINSAKNNRAGQAYAILTLSRAYYTFKNGEQVSKIKAADWMKKQFPEYSSLIDNAVLWRKEYKNKNVNPELTYPETEKFVHYIIDKINR